VATQFEFFVGIVKLGLRFDPASKRFGSGKRFVRIGLVHQVNSLTGASSFHAVFEFGLGVIQFLREFSFLQTGYGSSR
jgi:hypothetical protein